MGRLDSRKIIRCRRYSQIVPLRCCSVCCRQRMMDITIRTAGVHAVTRSSKNFLVSWFPDSFQVGSLPLLHGHNCADWNFGEEFARGIFRQSDTPM